MNNGEGTCGLLGDKLLFYLKTQSAS